MVVVGGGKENRRGRSRAFCGKCLLSEAAIDTHSFNNDPITKTFRVEQIIKRKAHIHVRTSLYYYNFYFSYKSYIIMKCQFCVFMHYDHDFEMFFFFVVKKKKKSYLRIIITNNK